MENSSEKVYKLLELYSGIGGMRFALEAAGIPYQIVASIDINPVVNEIYCYNFGKHGHMQGNILSFTVDAIENMKLDLITMSPPCQPFTRNGLKKDIEDTRTSSFLHILDVISKLKEKPGYIFLENVKGFEESCMKNILIETLRHCGYVFQEFLLSPTLFGIPNSRLRYYLIAKLENMKLCFLHGEKILFEMPPNVDFQTYQCSKCLQDDSHLRRCSLKHFLEEKPREYFDTYMISDKILLKYWSVFDIVTEDSSTSCCFTKAYSHYALGTGSVLILANDIDVSDTLQKISLSADSKEQLNMLKSIRLRYFTPKEVANIMCFPSKFDFPPNLSTKQRYKAVGNSLNIFVVACLLKLLLTEQPITVPNQG